MYNLHQIRKQLQNVERTYKPQHPQGRVRESLQSYVTFQILFWFIFLNSLKSLGFSRQIECIDKKMCAESMKMFNGCLNKTEAAGTVRDISSDSPAD